MTLLVIVSKACAAAGEEDITHDCGRPVAKEARHDDLFPLHHWLRSTHSAIFGQGMHATTAASHLSDILGEVLERANQVVRLVLIWLIPQVRPALPPGHCLGGG